MERFYQNAALLAFLIYGSHVPDDARSAEAGITRPQLRYSLCHVSDLYDANREIFDVVSCYVKRPWINSFTENLNIEVRI